MATYFRYFTDFDCGKTIDRENNCLETGPVLKDYPKIKHYLRTHLGIELPLNRDWYTSILTPKNVSLLCSLDAYLFYL